MLRNITRLTILLLLALVPLRAARAQEQQSALPQFGYLSYDEVFEQMPEYQEAKEAFAELKVKYDAETARSEDEFQRKFTEFLQGQKDFPPSIMQKRQAELQDLMDKSVAFRKETRRLLKEAETELQAPVLVRLNEAIQAVGEELGLLFVLNTDGNALPFVNPQMGVDVTLPVLMKLGLITTANPELPALPATLPPAQETTPAAAVDTTPAEPAPATPETETTTPTPPVR
ncbi:MAG: OmpH family outer membrane protein [Bacteroidaceae bacterium]|nr:OmpH family outer membrane protein [Bacteroidaceae bacterium]